MGSDSTTLRPLSPALASDRPHGILSFGILLWHSQGAGLVQETEAGRCREAGSRTPVLKLLGPGAHSDLPGRGLASSRLQDAPCCRKRKRAETGACAEGTQFGGGASVRRGGARSLGEERGGCQNLLYLHHSGLSPGSPVRFYPSDRVPSTPPPTRSWTEFLPVPGWKALLWDGLGHSGCGWWCGRTNMRLWNLRPISDPGTLLPQPYWGVRGEQNGSGYLPHLEVPALVIIVDREERKGSLPWQ